LRVPPQAAFETDRRAMPDKERGLLGGDRVTRVGYPAPGPAQATFKFGSDSSKGGRMLEISIMSNIRTSGTKRTSAAGRYWEKKCP